ncbi:hypothetical protein Mapa_000583 [Marchantia paleacea]|nr:hypothetical protein Mapa_000583 [Marchantia paleacea]
MLEVGKEKTGLGHDLRISTRITEKNAPHFSMQPIQTGGTLTLIEAGYGGSGSGAVRSSARVAPRA